MEAIGPTFDIEGSPNDGANLHIFFLEKKKNYTHASVRHDCGKKYIKENNPPCSVVF